MNPLMKTEHIKIVLLWLLVFVAIIVVTDNLNRHLGLKVAHLKRDSIAVKGFPAVLISGTDFCHQFVRTAAN
jgi:hypothetical protein